VNGNIVIAEQIHNIALPAGKLTPIMNTAIYEIVDVKIAAWVTIPTPRTQRSYSVSNATITNKRKT
jgi:limonene-1,2-epoxide hydrolase